MDKQLLPYTISNAFFSTYRQETVGDKSFLVVKGVPLVEGVLNGRLVQSDEFGKFVKDWDGVPVVMRHPKQNGGSARVVSPDVPVIGRFYNASIDGTRLVGEFWLDESTLSDDEGQRVIEKIKANHPIELSTGYYAESISQVGKWNELDYGLIDKNLHPDHIAILPDEIGACSVKDGCGLNRNQLSVYFNAITKKEAWGEESAGSYLVVEDPEKVTTWHLPVKKDGKLDRRLAARAWSELFSGGRTGKGYEGPEKDKAKEKLKKIYEANDWPFPDAKQNSYDGSLESMTEEIYQSFNKQFQTSASASGAIPAYGNDFWIAKTYPDHVICSTAGELYWVNYTKEDGEIVFNDRSKWVQVERKEQYIPVQQNVTGLTGAAAKMWEDIYQKAKEQYKDRKDTEAIAAQTAWAAIKEKYEKDKDGNWVLKNAAELIRHDEDIPQWQLEGLASLVAFVAE